MRHFTWELNQFKDAQDSDEGDCCHFIVNENYLYDPDSSRRNETETADLKNKRLKMKLARWKIVGERKWQNTNICLEMANIRLISVVSSFTQHIQNSSTSCAFLSQHSAVELSLRVSRKMSARIYHQAKCPFTATLPPKLIRSDFLFRVLSLCQVLFTFHSEGESERSSPTGESTCHKQSTRELLRMLNRV